MKAYGQHDTHHFPKSVLACLLMIVLGTVFASPGYSRDLANRHYDLVFNHVALRDGVAFDMHLIVYVNKSVPCRDPNRTLLAVHGYAHSAATWQNFSNALFADRSNLIPICRVVAMDLPGHGASSLPTGDKYSNVTLEDYVTAMAAALDRLPSVGLRPKAIIGHSQGGILVQMLQQRLLQQRTNLRQQYDISNVTLLAPTPPAALPWRLADAGDAAFLLQSFLISDATTGDILVYPGEVFPNLFFTNFQGVVAPGTPDLDVLNSYTAPEPLISSLELMGLPPIPQRPQVSRNIFADKGFKTVLQGTFVRTVSFANDTVVLSDEAQQIYLYLSGDAAFHRYVDVSGQYAVHDMYIADPATMLQAITAREFEFWNGAFLPPR